MQHLFLPYEAEICTQDLAIPIPNSASHPINNPHICATPYGKIAYGCDKGARESNMDVILIDPAKKAIAIIDGMGGYGIESSKALLPITYFLQQSVRGELDINLAHQYAQQELNQQNIRGAAVYFLVRFNGKTYNCAAAGDIGFVHFNSQNDICLKASLKHLIILQ